MKNRRRIITQYVLHGLLPICMLSSCAAPQNRVAKRSRDHGFIAYWPPSAENNGLRLAVKDLIDMKGVVTTAGSEHLARTSPPAAEDAECLMSRADHALYASMAMGRNRFSVDG